MTAKTHIVGGVLAAEALCLALGIRDPAVALPCSAAAAFGALLPDIDHINRRISRTSLATRAASLAVSAVTHHRGVIHTPVFILAVAFLAAGVSYAGLPNGWQLTAALCAGMVSHLVLDSLNPGGIMWLWPVSKRRIHVASIRTGHVGEYLVLALLVVAAAALAGEALLPALADAARRMMR